MYGSISIRGASVNKLKNVSLDILKRKITVFTGVSGSGKSSLVFGTLAGLMQQLRDKGNTVLVVEHKPDMIRIADDIIDMAPSPAARAARWVYQGGFAGLLNSGTLTGNHINRQPVKTSRASPTASSRSGKRSSTTSRTSR
jgi:excinuclease UvrABC ATPase subunit